MVTARGLPPLGTDNGCVTWSGRYWTIALAAWLFATVGGVVWALATSSPWIKPMTWSGGWLLFAIALWWAIATMRSDSTPAQDE